MPTIEITDEEILSSLERISFTRPCTYWSVERSSFCDEGRFIWYEEVPTGKFTPKGKPRMKTVQRTEKCPECLGTGTMPTDFIKKIVKVLIENYGFTIAAGMPLKTS